MKPKEIIIMADYGSGAYAWDEKGVPYDFENIPNIEGIGEIISELERWQEWFQKGTLADKDFLQTTPFARNFPWEEFHAKGLELARRIRRLIDPEIKLVYSNPVEDPNYKIDENTEIR